MSNVEKQRVERIVVEWARAVSAGDRKAILEHHSKDLLMFDFKDIVEGIGAYGGTGISSTLTRRGRLPMNRPTFGWPPGKMWPLSHAMFTATERQPDHSTSA